MANEIAVAAARPNNSSGWLAVTAPYAVVVGLLSVGITMALGDSTGALLNRREEWSLVVTALVDYPFLRVVLPLALMSPVLFGRNGDGEKREVVVSVYPLGIQLFTRRRETKHRLAGGRVCFVPRDHLFDCIVLERIEATEVTSRVMFRLKAQSNKSGVNSKRKELSLIEAFPGGREMSYVECLEMRSRILKVLAETASKGEEQEVSEQKASQKHGQ